MKVNLTRAYHNNRKADPLGIQNINIKLTAYIAFGKFQVPSENGLAAFTKLNPLETARGSSIVFKRIRMALRYSYLVAVGNAGGRKLLSLVVKQAHSNRQINMAIGKQKNI